MFSNSMPVVLEQEPMAKKRGRPKLSQRVDSAVKIDARLAGMAKTLATAKGVSVAEFLSETLRAPLAREYAKHMRALELEGLEGQSEN